MFRPGGGANINRSQDIGSFDAPIDSVHDVYADDDDDDDDGNNVSYGGIRTLPIRSRPLPVERGSVSPWDLGGWNGLVCTAPAWQGLPAEL